MNYNNFRRGRSPPPSQPPFGYDNSIRPIPNHREFDSPFYPTNPYEGPGRPPHHHVGKMPQPPMSPMAQTHPNQLAHPMAPYPYADAPAHHQNYPPHYREQLYGPHQLPQPPPQPSNSYPRSAIGHRDPHMDGGVPHLHQHAIPPPPQSRSHSPPYKILCITNINHKVDDGLVKEALTSDFSRFGDISVSVCHDNGERLAYIYFRNYEEAREARHIKTRALLFDQPIEIEPIYVRGSGSPGRMSPGPGTPVLHPTYSPRRQSVSPPSYARDPSVPSRRPLPPHMHHSSDGPLTPTGYLQHRGSTPPDYTGYHQGPSPPQPMSAAPIPPPYDRRPHHSAYPQAHIASPYTSPPHESHRPAYASHPMPYPVTSGARERSHTERLHVSSRSPHHDPYYPPKETRAGPPPVPHHHSSSSSSSGRYSSRSSSRHSNVPPGPYRDDHIPVRQRYPANPPARYMSREFRREKFGSDPYGGEHDEARPSRVLLVNNIDATKTELDLKEIFEPFGIIEEMEVKKTASDVSSALVKFSSMDGAYKAKTANNGRYIGSSRCRIVYGKVTASRRLWIGGLCPGWTVSMMEEECGKYGDITSVDYTAGRPYCYVEYETANQAQFAAHHMRTTLTPASERKIRIEFVDPERSEKLLPRHNSNSHASEPNSKPRVAADPFNDLDASPHSIGGLSGRKRSVSPSSDLSNSKRVCQPCELPLAANTFKQERLDAAAAAKARTSSTTSSLASQSMDKSSKTGDIQDNNELNNNSDIEQVAGNGDVISNEKTPHIETPILLEAPSLDQLAQCTTIKEVVACCSVSWPSHIALRNFIFPAQIHMCSGRKQILDKYLTRPVGENGLSTSPLLQITQRWRLHPQPKLEEVKRRMQSGNLGILVLTARQDGSLASRHIVAAAAAATPASDSLNVSTASDSSGQQVVPHGNVENQTGSENGQPHQHNGNIEKTPQSATAADEAPQNPIDKSDVACKLSNEQIEINATASNPLAATSGAAGPSTPNHVVGTPPTSGSSNQSRPLRNLISYLEQKDAAGVISLSASVGASGEQALATPEGSTSSSKLLYAFPPGDFALNLLKRKAPNLATEAVKDEFLLGVIVGGNVESGRM